MRKLRFSFIAFCFLIVGILAFEFVTMSANTTDGADNSASCLIKDYNFEKVKDYLKNKYSEYSISIKEHDKKQLDFICNFDQKDLNDGFKEKIGIKITGTCTNVACAALIYHYSFYDKYDTNVVVEDEQSRKDFLVKIYTNNLCEGYTSADGGTEKINIKHCVTASFDLYNNNVISNSRYGKTKGASLMNNIDDAVNGGVDMIILDLSDHSVAVAGITYFDVTYTHETTVGWWWWEKHTETVTETMTEKFIIVCEGWGCENLSLVPSESIGSFCNAMQVTWAIKR